MYWLVIISVVTCVLAYPYCVGLETFLAKYRWVFVCFLLLPMSVIFEFYLAFRNWLIFQMKSAPRMHDEKVKKIQNEIKSWNDEGRERKMCTGRPGWMTMSLRVGKAFQILHHIVLHKNSSHEKRLI